MEIQKCQHQDYQSRNIKDSECPSRWLEVLKKAGLFFAPKKVMWYYRPSEEKCLNTKPKDIDEIRKKYGSEKIDGHSPGNFGLTAG
jgi:hypothetical protein